MENMSQRGGIVSSADKKSPSPADYKIKSNFDIIVEEGQKISKIRNKINMQNSMEIKRRKNINEKEENNNSKLILDTNNNK